LAAQKHFSPKIRQNDMTNSRNTPQKMRCCLNFPEMSYMLM